MNRLILLTAAALVTLSAAGCSKPSQPATVAAKSLTPVRAWVVRPAATAPELRYAGSLEPLTQVTLAFRAPGAVEAIHQVRGIDGRSRALETGDCVAAGTTLARIRAVEFQARTDAASAQIADAQASRAAAAAQVDEALAGLAQAELDWGRAQKLLASQAMTRAEADAVQARLDASKARAEAARAQVRAVDAKIAAAGAAAAESKVSLTDTVLAAPFASCVVSRSVERGAFVQPGAPAFTLADLTRVKVIFHVPDTELALVRSGTRVQALIEAAGAVEVNAVVQSISPAADPVTRNFRIEAIAPNPGYKLRAGLIASVRLPGAASPTPQAAELSVPLSAILRGNAEGTSFAVFTIDEKNAVHRQPVELGAARGNQVVISSGLAPDQRVVLEGVAALQDGETVQVME